MCLRVRTLLGNVPKSTPRGGSCQLGDDRRQPQASSISSPAAQGRGPKHFSGEGLGYLFGVPVPLNKRDKHLEYPFWLLPRYAYYHCGTEHAKLSGASGANARTSRRLPQIHLCLQLQLQVLRGMSHHAGLDLAPRGLYLEPAVHVWEVLTWSNLQCACYSALTSLLGTEEHGGI